MKAKFSPTVQRKIAEIHKQDKKLTEKLQKQILLFESNPKHPSLRVHKLTGKFKERWSISITRNVRMVYVQVNEDIAYFVAIGTHDQVYR